MTLSGPVRRTPVSRLRRALTRTGTLVIVGGEGDRWIGGVPRQLWASVLSAFVPRSLRTFVVKENAAELLAMNELVANPADDFFGSTG